MSIMGTRVLRTDDPRFLSTGATYTSDASDDRLRDAVHLTLVRSTVAHGMIPTVHVDAARRAPGVIAVVTGSGLDLPPLKLTGGALLHAR